MLTERSREFDDCPTDFSTRDYWSYIALIVAARPTILFSIVSDLLAQRSHRPALGNRKVH